ncbi:MAG: methylmalonyl Co-A mutase-associated GTPase MeaB, partial [Maribacter sp.]
AEFQRAIHMFPPKENGWTTKVVSCSAIQNEGMNLIWKMVQKYVAQVKGTGYFESNRQQQNESWLLQHIQGLLTDNFKQNKRIVQLLPKFKSEVMKGSLSPFAAAEKLMDAYRKF